MIGVIAPVLALDTVAWGRAGSITELCFHAGGQGCNVVGVLHSFDEGLCLTGYNGGESGVVLRSLLDDQGIPHRLVTIQGANRRRGGAQR